MNEHDYLWDGTGEPDADVAKLESSLAPFRYAPVPKAKRRMFAPLAIAASLVVAAGVTAYWLRTSANRPTWKLEGVASQAVLTQGRWLETDGATHARLDVADVGRVEIEPNSRVRLVRSKEGDHRMALQQGTIHAFIWAPPGDFAVETPSALTVDLGCAYDLSVLPGGESLVDVTAGWVAFDGAGKLSLIPAGAACLTRPRLGPGTPYYRDSSAEFRHAVEQFDLHGATGDLLSQARERDAFTLWHVLRRVPQSERGSVYDRLAQLVTMPPAVTRTGIVAGDPAMYTALWGSMGLGDLQFWERWTQKLR